MAEEFASPEEKLLRLIRGERKPKDKIVPEKPAARGEDKTVTAVPVRTTAPRFPKLGRSANYSRFINVSLIVSLVTIAVVIIIDVISFNSSRPAYVTGAAPKAGAGTVERVQNTPQPRPQARGPAAFSEGPELLGSRELFRVSPAAAAASARIPQAPFEKMKDLSLKGIIAGDKPQAILEDEKNKKSYFLYKGDSVNNIKVEDIQSDRVILIINGEALELTL